MKRFYVAIALGLLISLLAGIAAIAEEDIMATAELETIESADAEGTPEIKPQNKEPSHCIFAPWFNAKTSIAFSSGVDKEWAYGNQQKEFSAAKSCYVRIGSSIVATWHWGWRYGNGKEITITYLFTGTENCAVEVSDGFLTEVKTDDPNVMEFTRKLKAKGSDEEDVVVFRYTPSGTGSISLEVIYDDQVNSEYDARRTVYFVEEDW